MGLLGQPSAPWGRGGAQPQGSVRVDDEAGESAVLVAVAAVGFATIQLDEDLITRIQVQDHTVAGIVIVLVCILSNGAGPDLTRRGNDLLMV